MFSNNSMRESSSGGVLQTPQYEINAPDDAEDDRGNHNNKNYVANADVLTFLWWSFAFDGLQNEVKAEC